MVEGLATFRTAVRDRLNKLQIEAMSYGVLVVSQKNDRGPLLKTSLIGKRFTGICSKHTLVCFNSHMDAVMTLSSWKK